MAPALELALHQRIALGGGQALDPRDQRRDPFALSGHLRRLKHAIEVLVEMLVSRLVAQVVEGPVANDRVQPRLQLDLGLAFQQGSVGLGERLLNDVFGSIGRDDRSREGHQRLPVAANDLLEGARVPLPGQPHEPRVGLAAKRQAGEGSSTGRSWHPHSQSSDRDYR